MERRKNEKKNVLIVLIIVSLFLFAVIADAGARKGCCSRHDGVEKYTCSHGGIGYRCGDGTSLSATCDPYYAECSEYTSPQVVTKKATSITATSATLEGNLDSTGAPIASERSHSGSISCQIWFEYGATTSYGSSTTKESTSSSGTFSEHISSLSPGTTYHFRALSTSGVGTDYGSDMSFETPTPTPTPIPSQPPITEGTLSIDNETLRIGAFNIQVFGKSKAAKQEVMDVLAKIIRTYDVVAIQEIRDKDQTALPTLVNLVNANGSQYEYIVGPRLGRTSNKEQYAYIYNNQTVNLNGTPWTYPEPNGTDPFHREPYIAAFRAVNGSFDATFLVIHVDPDEATAEINALDAVVNYTKGEYPDEQDFIVMGDLNADCSYFDEDSNSSMSGSNYYWCINNSIDTTTSATDCTYDCIIISSPAVPDYTGISGVFRYDLVYNLTEDETRAVSDHYPIYAVFYCDGDIDTPEKGGSLSVNSSPLGATIYLDGSYKGKTPRTITEVSPDDHTIKLTLEGYYDWSTSVNAKTSEISYVHATLTPIPTTGTISVHSSPSGATIKLDEFIGPPITTPHTFTMVSPGHYKFELSLEGYYDWSTSVNAKAGETSYVHATLTPIPTTGPITPTPTTTATLFEKIEGLTAIRVGGGFWDNWDADMENDGPVIYIVYLDARGDSITDDSTEMMPISADVKLYAGDSFSGPYDKLVFSAHYTEDEIILGSIFPDIHIPKEEISVDPSTDYWRGAVEVTIYTPSQGSFADRYDYIRLYEE